MKVVESAPPLRGQFTSVALDTDYSTECIMGPEDPLEHFPVALLSKAIAAAVEEFKIERPESGIGREERALATVVNILSLNRIYWGETHDGEINLVKFGSGTLGILNQDGLLLDLRLSENFTNNNSGAVPRYFMGFPEDHPAIATLEDVRVLESEFVQSLEKMTFGAVERKLIHGHPSLVFPEHHAGERRVLRDVAMSVLGVVRNSPFNPKLYLPSSKKPRFKFINAINAGDNKEAVGFVKDTITRYPRLIEMPGWCGGIAFHKASQLGQIELLRTLINLGKSVEIVETTNKSLTDLLATRDADGSTPSQLALRYGNPECVDLLLAEGANLESANNFGFVPDSEALEVVRKGPKRSSGQ